jgi:hypothetical protein
MHFTGNGFRLELRGICYYTHVLLLHPRSWSSGTGRRFLTVIQAKNNPNGSVWTKRSPIASVETLTCLTREDTPSHENSRLGSFRGHVERWPFPLPPRRAWPRPHVGAASTGG